MNVPNQLQYTTTHLWLEAMEDNQYRVGITDFAQNELGDIVYVEPPELERDYGQLDECAVIESVKSTSDIYCPLSGTIIKVNELLAEQAEIINTEPYDEGWLFIIQATDQTELGELINATTYLELINEE